MGCIVKMLHTIIPPYDPSSSHSVLQPEIVLKYIHAMEPRTLSPYIKR